MPLRIRIDINGHNIETYWIGRVEGKAFPDDINTYVIGLGTAEQAPWDTSDWWGKGYEDLTQFTHRYGDGAAVCVRKGLEAMEDDVREAPVHE